MPISMAVRVLAAACLSLLVAVPEGRAAQDEDNFLTSITITQASNWVMTLDEKMLQHYLVYPGSSLNPLASVNVTYRLKAPSGSIWGDGQRYEEFWFHNGDAVGLRRFRNVVFPPDSYGLVVIKPLAPDITETRSLVNASIHLLLEIAAQNSGLIAIVAPRNLCEKAASDLGSFQFLPVQRIRGDAQVVLLHLVSYPEGFDKYYYFASGPSPAIN